MNAAPIVPRIQVQAWAMPREKDPRPVFVLLVTGSRFAGEQVHCDKMSRALKAILQKYLPSEWRLVLIHGGANGADAYCSGWAWVNDFAEVWAFDAEWDKHKIPGSKFNPAGHIRNEEMVHHVVSERSLGAKVGCLAFPDENAFYLRQAGKKYKSGTLHCVTAAEKAGIKPLLVPLRVKEK